MNLVELVDVTDPWSGGPGETEKILAERRAARGRAIGALKAVNNAKKKTRL